MRTRFAMAIGLLVFLETVGLAAVPNQMAVQGRLTDAVGLPPAAGVKQFVFRVFNAPSGGTEIWPGGAGEIQSVSTDAQGMWKANIGAQIPLTTAVFAGAATWLEITVDDGQNAVTLPRMQLVTSPYAHRVASIDGAAGGALTSGIDLPHYGSTLDGNASGIRWMLGSNIQTAFGFDVFYGLYFQGSWEDLNDDFGVRAPTIDGTLGAVVFNVSRNGTVTANGVLNAPGVSTGYINATSNINANGNIYCGGLITNYNIHSGNGVYADDAIQAGTSLIAGTNVYTTNVIASGYVCANSYSCPSDERLKTGVEDLPDAMATVNHLRGVRYEWQSDRFPERKFPAGPQIGLIAQEVKAVVPQAVTEGEDGYLAVDYARLVPVLIEAIKEQQRTIDGLKAAIQQQREDIETLRSTIQQ